MVDRSFLMADLMNLFRGWRLGRDEVTATHLQFADDIIILCEEGDISSMRNLKELVEVFPRISGLKEAMMDVSGVGVVPLTKTKSANRSHVVHVTKVFSQMKDGLVGEVLATNIRGFTKEKDQDAWLEIFWLMVTEFDVVDVLEIVMKHHTSDITSRAMSLIALLKLSSRFPSCSKRIKEIIVQQKGNFVLELQQRAIEFNSIIEKHRNIRSALVERMPVLDEATYGGRRAGSLPTTVSTSKGASLNLPNGVTKPAAAPLIDLLDLGSDDAPAPSSSAGDFLQDLLGVDLAPVSSLPGTSQVPPSGTDMLLDLLSIGTSPVQDSLSTVDILSSSHDSKTSVAPLEGLTSLSYPLSKQVFSPTEAASVVDLLNGLTPNFSTLGGNGPVYPSIVAFQSNSLKIMFSFSKQPGNPQTTFILATFTNMSSNAYMDFVFQAAVPKFVQLHLDPASSNTLPASGSESVTQSLRVTNSQHGQKPLAMRIRIAYKVNNQDVLEQGQINNFPAGL
ncbi:PREDICTED: AP-1 complex subunit gamma-2-like [Nelumbo nucifera]|uniref:AP-1 complex subunit gamma-2-like n=1 Tax=Nelumbo nucifera TaxID=4432 RepID=A0A1U8APJ7_NELNU|nr:PREDICTED: AP-1 complex subunit gamma-2-like [Nelumbo nucifera]